MEFRILGPLEVVENGRPVDVGGPKQRALLCVLLLEANRVVSTDRLIDALWEESPPETAQKALQVHVSQLRKALGKERVVTRPAGYLLSVEEGELDLERFQPLMEEGKLREALSLWQGPPLSEFANQRFAHAEIARFEELRLACLEERVDRDLTDGHHAELVGELRALVAEHPLRERLRAQLMVALYRSGRQAEALATYQECRRLLSEELGLEPNEELKRLEKAILQHDTALNMSAALRRPATEARVAERSILVVPRALAGLVTLLRLAEPLAASQPLRELIITSIVDTTELPAATAALADLRDDLLARGVTSRTAAFSSPTPGEDLVRLASQQDVDLLLLAAGDSPLGGHAAVVLEQAPCDVALVLEAGGPLRAGPVLVPFGAAEHDWAALELGAWIAHATGAPLRLMGTASDKQGDARDASRLLADASLIVQRTAGIVAEPLLASPGREGVIALAEGAGLLVVGLSERWRQEGLGKVRSEIAGAPPAPTVFVRRGRRPGGLAPAETRTRFTWSLAATGR